MAIVSNELSTVTRQWEGAWVTATAYIVNDEVANDGDAYICTQAHTSGASTEPGTGGSWTSYWDLFATGGGMVGPGSSTDNAVVRFNGTTGGVAQNSGVIIDDSNNVTAPAALTVQGAFTSLGIDDNATAEKIDITDSAIVFNEAGGDVDFRVEGSGAANALFVQGSNGNVGIGVIPEAWHANYTVLRVGDRTYIGNYQDDSVQFGHNAYYDGSYKRIETGYAGRMGVNTASGYFFFDIAGTAAADSAISFTRVFHIDNSGNIGMGLSSSISARLHLISTTEQQRIGYDVSNHFSTTVDANANVTFNLTAGAGTPGFTFSDKVRVDGGFGLNVTPQVQQAHIVDADGSLEDITTKFNTLLADLEGFGFLLTS